MVTVYCVSPVQVRQMAYVAMPTTLSGLQTHDLAPVISSYSVKGFTVRGNKLVGSLALLPRGIFHWKVVRIFCKFE